MQGITLHQHGHSIHILELRGWDAQWNVGDAVKARQERLDVWTYANAGHVRDGSWCGTIRRPLGPTEALFPPSAHHDLLGCLVFSSPRQL
jgi:hypothetical protein